MNGEPPWTLTPPLPLPLLLLPLLPGDDDDAAAAADEGGGRGGGKTSLQAPVTKSQRTNLAGETSVMKSSSSCRTMGSQFFWTTAFIHMRGEGVEEEERSSEQAYHQMNKNEGEEQVGLPPAKSRLKWSHQSRAQTFPLLPAIPLLTAPPLLMLALTLGCRSSRLPPLS